MFPAFVTLGTITDLDQWLSTMESISINYTQSFKKQDLIVSLLRSIVAKILNKQIADVDDSLLLIEGGFNVPITL